MYTVCTLYVHGELMTTNGIDLTRLTCSVVRPRPSRSSWSAPAIKVKVHAVASRFALNADEPIQSSADGLDDRHLQSVIQGGGKATYVIKLVHRTLLEWKLR